MKAVPSGPPGRRPRRWSAVLAPALLGAALLLVLLVSQAERIRAAGEAYVYGLPLLMVDLTREQAALGTGPENRLLRVRRFPDASFKGVVRPNVDTLYTTAFIDMALGPWVFEMPANDQRYEVMAFMDAWTNVFAAPGTRVSGTGGGRYLLAGPTWQGVVPEGLQLLRSPTRIVWLIGRTQTLGAADYPVVHRLQDGLTLRRLSESPSTEPSWQRGREPALPPWQQLRAMETVALFNRLAALMRDNPPAAVDAPMLARLAVLGVVPGQPLRWGPLDRACAALGRWVADYQLARALAQPRAAVGGWVTPPANLGQYGEDYATRAAVAIVGLGANLPADAIYPQARVDAQGAALHGSHRYRLHFKAGGLPPVRAFWSVTVYGADDFLIDNPLQRHALGDRDPLRFNADGSLDLWIQAESPGAERQANWLPVRAGAPFVLNARLYWPKPEALSGAWQMPAVERLD